MVPLASLEGGGPGGGPGGAALAPPPPSWPPPLALAFDSIERNAATPAASVVVPESAVEVDVVVEGEADDELVPAPEPSLVVPDVACADCCCNSW